MFLVVTINTSLHGQSNFSRESYLQFLINHQNLEYDDIQAYYASNQVYYKNYQDFTDLKECLYLDSIATKLNLTDDELELLRQNQFMVTERLSEPTFLTAFLNIFHRDLPVFISTDAILQTIHDSYDQILKDIEIELLKPDLKQLLYQLYNGIPSIINKYQNYPNLSLSLQDIDLYVTMAYSLLDSTLYPQHIVGQSTLTQVWDAVMSETYVELPLFSFSKRRLDYSQFIVRGHYDCAELRHYFKSMMWLGRTDFILSNAECTRLTPDDVWRMNIDAFLLNELITGTDSWALLTRLDAIIRFFIGESDNLTPQELADFIAIQNLTSASELLDTTVYQDYCQDLLTYPHSGQKILSDIFIMNPLATTPDPLPISYRLLGQRFIIDSYILSNVVYDRIIYQGRKIWRPLPDPLDAMFVLGNNNALPLIKTEIDSFHYATNLNALRYLVDSYDDDFWHISIYNLWLNAIRSLNPVSQDKGEPLFMRSVAWQHAKLNSQLASWAQLRHDNLLYAKQSYTGGWICSFPHTYIEPNPEFFAQLSSYASRAKELFASHGITNPEIYDYLDTLKYIMNRLATLAYKELNHQPFYDEEKAFLQGMLFPPDGMCGSIPTGWYTHLIYKYSQFYSDVGKPVIADVHTQPTDQFGGLVGKVLHIGTGKVNLGVFIAPSPSYGFTNMAYVGPIMSSFQKVTTGFERINDQRWQELVWSGQLPERPDWVNIFLADKSGKRRPQGREIPAQDYQSGTVLNPENKPKAFQLYPNYPNPFNISTQIRYDLPEKAYVTLTICNLYGQVVAQLVNELQAAGGYTIRWNGTNLSSGIYLYRLSTGKYQQTGKAVLVK